MIDTNALLLCDTYKTCHDRMYPNSLNKLVSDWVPRKSMFQDEENQKMVFFGLQAFIQEFLVEYFNKNFFSAFFILCKLLIFFKLYHTDWCIVNYFTPIGVK